MAEINNKGRVVRLAGFSGSNPAILQTSVQGFLTQIGERHIIAIEATAAYDGTDLIHTFWIYYID